MRRYVLAALVAVIVLCWSEAALAQRVVLVRLTRATQVERAAFHRLRAELALNDFEVTDVQVSDTPTREGLAGIGEEHGAVATVFIVGARVATADIWIVDATTGKTSIRTLAPPAGEPGSDLLAIRAVELLKLSLRELDVAEAPHDVVGAHPERAPEHVRRWAEAPRGRFEAMTGGGALWLGSDFEGVVPIGTLSLGFHASERLRLGVEGFATFGAVAAVEPTATAQTNLWGGCLQLGLALLKIQRLDALLTLQSGFAVVHAAGSGTAPLVGVRTTLQAFVLSPGLEVGWQFMRAARLSGAAQAMMLLPKTGVRVAEHVHWISTPSVRATLGVGFNF